MRRFFLGVSFTFATLVILGCGSDAPETALSKTDALAQSGVSQETPSPDRKKKNASGLPIAISRETTHITQPLRADGYPNYGAALDERQSKGVTTGNNYAVALVEVFGPHQIKEGIRAAYFAKLGIEPLAEEGDYLVDFDDYLAEANPFLKEAINQSYDERDFASEPWTSEDFPELAQWQDDYAAQLDRLIPTARHTKYYTPIVTNEENSSVLAVALPNTQHFRDAARALLERAMRRVGERDFDAAWEDVMACRRIAQLVRQGPGLINALIGNALDGMAHQAIIAIASEPHLTRVMIDEYRHDLKSLPPRPDMLVAMQPAERFMCLDMICSLAHEGPTSLHSVMWVYEGGMDNVFGALFEPITGDGTVEEAIQQSTEEMLRGLTPDEKRQRQMELLYEAIDWDVVLTTCNAFYDRLQAIAKIDDPKQRSNKLEELLAEYERLGSLDGLKDLNEEVPAEKHKEFSLRLAGSFFNLMAPAIPTSLQSQQRTITEDRLADCALALAAYWVEQDRLPERLEQLVPDYVAEIPRDAFSNAPLRYVPRDEGYLLYSIGPNMQDEEGSGPYTDGIGDDITVVVGDAESE